MNAYEIDISLVAKYMNYLQCVHGIYPLEAADLFFEGYEIKQLKAALDWSEKTDERSA